MARAVGDERILALALNNKADHALTVGDYERAEPLFEESLALLEARGDTANVARSMFNLGAVALQEGRLDTAGARFRESLARSRAAGDKEDLCWCLLGIAALAAARGDADRAAVLLGAAVELLDQMGAAFKPFERRLHRETEEKVAQLLEGAELESSRKRGAAMSLDQALEYATA